MHGLGDNLHQRAVLRQLMAREPVYLETSWPCAYRDLAGPRLHLLAKPSGLRTQAKNARREAAAFSHARPEGRSVRVWYAPDDVRRHGSVLAAMCANTETSFEAADFRLPVPDAWRQRATTWIAKWRPTKPLLLYRPLNERTEWTGCRARNPDHAAYAALVRSIRDRFFVVSVADLDPGKEWMVGDDIGADVECHRGELEFETLAALAAQAALVVSSPGFAIILAQAVGTSSVCIFGGYENAQSFAGGARHAPYLGIEPISPCQCFRHDHACDKRIEFPAAIARLRAFTDEALT